MFDYRVAGTRTTFHGCRGLLITTDGTHRIETIHASIVSKPVSLPVLQLILETTRRQLAAQGWRPLQSPNDFSRADTWLELGSTRVDDDRNDADEHSGEWIATVDLKALRAYKP